MIQKTGDTVLNQFSGSSAARTDHGLSGKHALDCRSPEGFRARTHEQKVRIL